MKTRSRSGGRRFQLQVLSYGNGYYIERVAQLERALARKPDALEIELVGIGEIPADTALRIRAVLLARPSGTRILTHARSSLQNGSVLVWLLGDERRIRDDATLFFRRANLGDREEAGSEEPWKEAEPGFRDSFSEIDPEEGDHARVLQLIDEYLPVTELVGRLIHLPVLRQFGLVENELADRFLATLLGKSGGPARPPASQVEPGDHREQARSTRSRLAE